MLGLVGTVYTIVTYVDGHPEDQRPDIMAAIAAATQIVGLAGGIYDIVSKIRLFL